MSQLSRVLEMNRAHVELLRAFQIQFPVVDEQTFVRAALRNFERKFIDALVRFSNS
jgi:hypothetical protein